MSLKCNVCGAIVSSGKKCPYCNSVLGEEPVVKENNKNDFSSTIEKAKRSVVKVIVSYKDSNTISIGSGCVMDNGLICTNAHVLNLVNGKERDAVFIQFPIEESDKAYEVAVLGVYANDDVAILKPLTHIPVSIGLPLGNSDNVQMGDHVFTIGNPKQQDFSYNEGVVSNPKRKHSDKQDYVIQTNINFNHGNSGGPLINNKGEIIGMATYSLTDLLETNVEGVEVQSDILGMGFCVTSNTIKKIINKIK